MGDRSRGRFATSADFPRHVVARTERYTNASQFWDLSIVQGPFSVTPCETLALRTIRNFCVAVYIILCSGRERVTPNRQISGGDLQLAVLHNALDLG